MPPPTPDPVDDDRSDEDRGISDVGLPHPGDDVRPDAESDAQVVDALDDAFPPEDAGRA